MAMPGVHERLLEPLLGWMTTVLGKFRIVWIAVVQLEERRSHASKLCFSFPGHIEVYLLKRLLETMNNTIRFLS